MTADEYVISSSVKQNDALYDLSFQCRDETGTGEDISGASEIRLKVYLLGATSSKINTTTHITEDDFETGKLLYTVQVGDFDIAGVEYLVEVQVTWATGKVLTYEGLRLSVRKEAPD